MISRMKRYVTSRAFIRHNPVWVTRRAAFAVYKLRVYLLLRWLSNAAERPRSEPRLNPVRQNRQVLSESTVVRPELRITPADSSVNTGRQARSYLPRRRFGTTMRPVAHSKLTFQLQGQVTADRRGVNARRRGSFQVGQPVGWAAERRQVCICICTGLHPMTRISRCQLVALVEAFLVTKGPPHLLRTTMATGRPQVPGSISSGTSS
jgi:hypothetical protein